MTIELSIILLRIVKLEKMYLKLLTKFSLGLVSITTAESLYPVVPIRASCSEFCVPFFIRYLVLPFEPGNLTVSRLSSRKFKILIVMVFMTTKSILRAPKTESNLVKIKRLDFDRTLTL